MNVATALLTGNDALPALVEQAVREALEKAALTQAKGVLLLLSPEFVRHARPALTAAARAAQCTQVVGGIVPGMFTECGWALDRPAAAVMVLGGDFALAPELPSADHAVSAADASEEPLLCFAGASFPVDWRAGGRRFGTSSDAHLATALPDDETHPQPLVWQQGRLCETQRSTARLLGVRLAIEESSGLQVLSAAQRVEQCNGYDVLRISGQAALRNLLQHLPEEMANAATGDWQRRLHLLSAVITDDTGNVEQSLACGRYQPITIIAANPDQSLTLAERIEPGRQFVWALRQADGAAADMARSLSRLATRAPSPAFMLMFSCIGRGPYFYGGDDRDVALARQRFPDLPLLGSYSTGQIAPAVPSGRADNRLQQNSVITALACPAAA